MIGCVIHNYLILFVLLLIFVVNSVQHLNNDPVKFLKLMKNARWLTHYRKLSLTAGSMLDLPFTLQIPLKENGDQLEASVNATCHFYMYLDTFGTNNELLPWPPFYPFSGFYPFGFLPIPRPRNPNNTMSSNSSASVSGSSSQSSFTLFTPLLNHFSSTRSKSRSRRPRQKREYDILSLPKPENLAGGERAGLIPQIENMLDSFGYNGQACLLRAVCEIHEVPLDKIGYGLLGEIVTLIFSISQSQYAESHLSEYLQAELAGKSKSEGERCTKYFTNCTLSLFANIKSFVIPK